MIYAENILLCIAVPLLLSIIFIKGDARLFSASFLIGMSVCLISAYISGFLDLVTGMGVNDTSVFLSPIVEEIMKLLPLIFIIVLIEPEDKTMLITTVGIGAGFATFENCCYILTFGVESFSYVLIRGMAVGVMHVVSLLMLAIGLILARHFDVLSLPAVMGALSLSATFHGLYNLLVSSPGISSAVGYAMPVAAAAILYLPFRMMSRYASDQ